MKKIFVLFVVFALVFVSSCTLDDDKHANFHFEALEAVEADFPETFEYGSIYRIKVKFNRPSDCYFFEGFDFDRTAETERVIAGIASVIESDNCEELQDSTIENYFDFEVRYTGTYTFKLWTGLDENEEDTYLIVEVPVEE